MSNLNYNEPAAGSGVKAVATETIASTEYQQLKIVDGTAASTSPVAAKAFGHQDANAAGATVFGLVVAALNQLWNGAADTFDRWRSASAANLLNKNSVGAASVAGPGQWATTPNTPAAGTLASASKAAGAAGVSHVCTGFSVSWASDGTANGAAQPVTIVLRDGATGAGTLLGQWTVARTTTTATDAQNAGSFSLTGLNLPGTAATAMTVEFSGTASSHELYSANLFGYDAQ